MIDRSKVIWHPDDAKHLIDKRVVAFNYVNDTDDNLQLGVLVSRDVGLFPFKVAVDKVKPYQYVDTPGFRFIIAEEDLEPEIPEVEVINVSFARPYIGNEMNELVGSVLVNRHTKAKAVVIKFTPPDENCANAHVRVGGGSKKDARALFDNWEFEDGSPCGVIMDIDI